MLGWVWHNGNGVDNYSNVIMVDGKEQILLLWSKEIPAIRLVKRTGQVKQPNRKEIRS